MARSLDDCSSDVIYYYSCDHRQIPPFRKMANCILLCRSPLSPHKNDPLQMGQELQNLITNGVQAISEGWGT